MKDLTKILKVGDEVYCTLSGRNEEVIEINPSKDITLNVDGIHIYVDKKGRYFPKFPDGEPIIYPSKENRDWDEWEVKQKALQQDDVSCSLPIFKCKCGYETSDSIGWCVHADCCNGDAR